MAPDTVTGRIASFWRPLVWLGFYGAILAAWGGLFAAVWQVPSLPGLTAAEFWASLCTPATGAGAFTLFGMWALMSAAMMLPTFAPALRVFGEMADARASDARGMAALVAGYGAVWLGFSAAAATAQGLLAGRGVLTAGGSTATPAITALLLLAAGAYQFSRIKAACLTRCRHPLVFFLQHWSPGTVAAAGMGMRLGVYCLGCCWALMSLGFVGGAMSLLWMGTATLFMTLEKLPGLGTGLTRPAGFALLAAGLWLGAATLYKM